MPDKTADYFLIFGIDGMGGYYINKALNKEDATQKGLEELCPTFAKLLKGTLEGFTTVVSTTNARTVYPPISTPAWVSILSGLTPDQTGIQNNDWPATEDQPLPLYSSPHDKSIPRTIFDYLPNAQHSGIVSWTGLGKKVLQFLPNVTTVLCDEKDDRVVEEFAKVMLTHTNGQKSGKPSIGLLHFDNVDHTGHVSTWGSEEYYASWKAQDDQLAAVLDMVKDKSVTLVVISDHGGSGKGHGTMNNTHMLIPMIIATSATCPKIVPTEAYTNAAQASPCTLSGIDLVPTLLNLLNIDKDPSLKGTALAAYAPSQ